jgi:aldehyde dehydrogenase (NAD+)
MHTQDQESAMQRLDRQYINGKVAAPDGTEVYLVNSAITGEQIAQGVLGDADDANAAVEAAHEALPAWSATSFEERRGYLSRLADSFAAHRDDMVSSLVEEFGTTTATAAYIVDQSADWFRMPASW